MTSATAIFGSFIVGLFILTTACSALKCNMCNSLMNGGSASDCSRNADYHAMNCMGTHAAQYCMKLNGTYTIRNNKTAGSVDPFVVVGEQRNCGSPYEIGLFYGLPVNGELCTTVERKNISLSPMNANPDNTFPNMTFVGTVCFCQGDGCNAAATIGFSVLTFLLSGLMTVF